MTAPETLPPELAELGELLREDPPRPDPTWARRLDSRAAAGFPRPPRRSPWAVLRSHRRALIPAVSFACVALLVVGLASVNLSSDDMAGSGGGGSGAASGGSESAGGGGGSDAGSAGSADSAGSTSLAAPRMKAAPVPGGGSAASDGRRSRAQERSAALTLAARPRQIERVAAGILRVTDAAGGFVASSSVASGAGSGGSFELRIPNPRLNRALADLSKLARVRERTQATRDITAETVSARGRLREAQREREGLLRALANATTINETDAVKARLRAVNARIASARGSVRRLANRASYANVSVELVSERGAAGVGGDGVHDGRWTPGDALEDAVRVLEVAAGIAVIVLAIALPLGLLAAFAALLARMLGHRRRERALDMA
jgi:Domain of unknown function (DUF4349)